MTSNSLISQAGFGYLPLPPTISKSDTLGVTPVKVTLPDINVPANQLSQLFSVTIVNPNPSATLAWMSVTRDAPAPTFSATYVEATPGGVPVLPGTSQTFIISARDDLYIVSDTAASKYAAAIVMY